MNQELIDCELKGNLVRLYLGKNGKQWGDDWDDKPYEHNAGHVYDEFVEKIADISINFEYDVNEPADFAIEGNSQWRREDFIKKKIHAISINNPENRSSIFIYFGETLENILKRIRYVAHNVYIPKEIKCKEKK